MTDIEKKTSLSESLRPKIEAAPFGVTTEQAAEQKEIRETGTNERPSTDAEPSATTTHRAPVKNFTAHPIPRRAVDPITERIEKIMEEGIGESYERLSPVAQQEFKLKGEEVAREIRELFDDTHLKIKKVFKLILQWLKLLPGINRFFLEQEAKIKADRIVIFHQRQQHSRD